MLNVSIFYFHRTLSVRWNMSELLVRREEDVLVVQFTAQKFLTDTIIGIIGRELLALVDEVEDGKMLIDFQGVVFISNPMIGKLVLLRKKCGRQKVCLRLCGFTPPIREVFEITRLDKDFSIHDTQAEALAAFARKLPLC